MSKAIKTIAIIGLFLTFSGFTIQTALAWDDRDDNNKFPGNIFNSIKDSSIAQRLQQGMPRNLTQVDNADRVPFWWGHSLVDLSSIISQLQTNPYTVYFDVNEEIRGDIIKPAKENNYIAQITERFYYVPNRISTWFPEGLLSNFFGFVSQQFCSSHNCTETKPFLTEEPVDNRVDFVGLCHCRITGQERVTAGCSLDACDPQYIKTEDGVSFCSSCLRDLWTCTRTYESGIYADPDFAQKGEGYTNCVAFRQIFRPFVHEDFVFDKNQKKWVLTENCTQGYECVNPGGDTDGDGEPDGDMAVIRPVNNDVVKLTMPRCYEYKKNKILTTTRGINCYADGLSADLRVGKGSFHYHKSGFGGILGGLLSLFLLALPFLNILVSVFWAVTAAVVGFVGAASISYTQMIMATIPSAYGTVEQFINNPVSVGFDDWDWTWNPVPSILIPPEITFNVPAESEDDDPIALSWSVSNATACWAGGDWIGDKLATPNLLHGEKIYNKPRGEYTFQLLCKNEVGIVSKIEKTMKVVYRPRCDFKADPATIAPRERSDLSWTCRFAESCRLENNPVNLSGTLMVSPTETTTYNLHCTGLDGSRDFPATITVDTGDSETEGDIWWQEIRPR